MEEAFKDNQTFLALCVVAVTLAIFAKRTLLKKRRGGGGACGSSCGCSSGKKSLKK